MKAAYAVAHDPLSIVFAPREAHSRLRRLLSHGFSTSSMLEQQPIIKGYVSLLIQRLRERGQNGAAKLNVCEWYNYTTFDIMGDLTFNESFGCLEKGEMHPWINLIFATMRTSAFMMALRRVPALTPLLPFLVSPKLIKQSLNHRKLTEEKVANRLAQGERPDFFQSLITPKGGLVRPTLFLLGD
jgi:cytochrome P450